MEISVILPVYNAEEYLHDAIKSILDQSFKNFEFIIINDGSNDSSLEIINSFDDARIVLIDQENKGLATSLNYGLSIARGKYIARMDADDIAFPERFETQLNFLKKNPQYKLVGAAVEVIDRDNNELCIDIPYTGHFFLKRFMLKIGNPFKHPTVMFEKEIALEVGGYNEKIGKYFEDYFLWSRIARDYKVEILTAVLLKYRITPGSIMSSIKDQEFSKFMKRVINENHFSNNDRKEMLEIKSNSVNHKMSNVESYNVRIYSIKTNRMNRLFVVLKRIFNIPIAIRIAVFLRKIRVFKNVYIG